VKDDKDGARSRAKRGGTLHVSRTHSAAERFAAATDLLLRCDGKALSTAGEELRPMLALAQDLRLDGPEPDPAFVAGLRAQLLARFNATNCGSAALRYATVETPLGTLGVAFRDGKVTYCSMLEASGEAGFAREAARTLGATPQRADELPSPLARAIRDHLAGRRRFTQVDIAWLPQFQQRVLQKTSEIPRGEVRPYAWIASEIGAPGAVRAVGTALGHNPLPYLIPCHRVVRADGTLGEYSGGGPARKERVLLYEGAPVDVLRHGLPRNDRFLGCRNTHIVCYPWCRDARRVRPENNLHFSTIAQASDAGYRPCKHCRPV
jgi:methylated-DNA-[protein]-cysteine S-methyltransferase